MQSITSQKENSKVQNPRVNIGRFKTSVHIKYKNVLLLLSTPGYKSCHTNKLQYLRFSIVWNSFFCFCCGYLENLKPMWLFSFRLYFNQKDRALEPLLTIIYHGILISQPKPESHFFLLNKLISLIPMRVQMFKFTEILTEIIPRNKYYFCVRWFDICNKRFIHMILLKEIHTTFTYIVICQNLTTN